MIWWLIIVAIVLILWFYFRFSFSFKHTKHKLRLVVILLLVLFLLSTIYKVVNDSKINVASLNGLASAGKAYFSWLGQLFSNSKNLIGDVIHTNWGNVTG